MIKIQLSPSEIAMASFVGCQRAVQNIQGGKTKSNSGEPEHAHFDRMIKGALAEAALAKHLDRYWWKGQKDLPDVGEVDVRCTHYENGHMEIHDWDKDNRKYYLLTGMLGSYTIRGWIYGKDGKKPEYWRVMQPGRPEQFWVPQAVLNPVIEKHFLDD